MCVGAKGYAWEGSFERSWDAIEEDESGQLKVNIATNTQERQRFVLPSSLPLHICSNATHSVLPS
jgi:hypothetical protein